MSLLALGLAIAMTPVNQSQIPESFYVGSFAAGVQAWSFNRFTAFEAVEKTALSGAHVIEFFPGQKLKPDSTAQMGPGMSAEDTTALKAHLEKFKVKAVAFGVTGIDANEARARPLFEWAKSMGIGVLNTESTDAIDTIEKLAKEFDIKVGFHNHPRQANNPNYKVWDPNYILELVKNRDLRVGSCADTGHWVRSGIKPVDALKILKGRVVSSHLKDLHEFNGGGHDVVFGTGVSDIAGILRAYKDMGFKGPISVEYEYNWDNSLPEIAQCIGFVRGFSAR